MIATGVRWYGEREGTANSRGIGPRDGNPIAASSRRDIDDRGRREAWSTGTSGREGGASVVDDVGGQRLIDGERMERTDAGSDRASDDVVRQVVETGRVHGYHASGPLRRALDQRRHHLRETPARGDGARVAEDRVAAWLVDCTGAELKGGAVVDVERYADGHQGREREGHVGDLRQHLRREGAERELDRDEGIARVATHDVSVVVRMRYAGARKDDRCADIARETEQRGAIERDARRIGEVDHGPETDARRGGVGEGRGKRE